MERAVTPYERFLAQSIDDQKRELDGLYNRFAHANPIEKRLLHREIETAIQNIEILSKNLDKYGRGLSWLREPSKERDEKAEKLGDIEEAEAPKPQAAAAQAPHPAVGRPVIGKPVVTSQPTSAPAPQAAPAKPARPVIGKPIGQPVKKDDQTS